MSHARVEATERRQAADLIEAVLENFHEYLEPLKYTVLAPSRYTVYVHADELARLDGILPLIRAEAERALSEAMARLNRRSKVHRFVDRLLDRQARPTENAGGTWHVEFLADPDGEVAPGGILVHSELLLPPAPELGVGHRTRRITTTRVGQQTTKTVEERATGATLEYEDNAGPHTTEIVSTETTIGRGGSAYPVDVRIVSSPDVSREHARIRRDATGWVLVDRSSLGTTLDGKPVPRDADVPLRDGARIGLASTVFLTFRIAR